MSILETKNLVKNFSGVRAVANLSLQFGLGRITGVIGPNGSGKTTLINLLSGIFPFDEGVMVVNETGLKKVQTFEALFFGITRTFQQIQLFEQMTTLDNILIVLTKKNVIGSLFEKHGDWQLNRAKEVLEKVGLWEKRNCLAVNLSYGQRKLLEIGRAIATGAQIYLLDEPFAGLFPEMRKTVSQLIRELKVEGKAVVLIEHDMDLIRELADYVFVLDSGELLAQGSPGKVLSDRKVVEAYLGD